MRRGGVWGIGNAGGVGIVVGALLLTGCGGGDAAEVPDTSDDTTTTATAATATTTTTAAPAVQIDDFDVAELLASLPPEATEDDIIVAAKDGGYRYVYAFPPQDLGNGVTGNLLVVLEDSPYGFDKILQWTLTGDSTSPDDFEFVVSLPKSWAENVDEIGFNVLPDEIIDDDPIVKWVADVAGGNQQIFGAVIPFLTDPEAADAMVPALVFLVNELHAHNALQVCRKQAEVDPAWANRCYLSVVALNPDVFNTATCRTAFNLDTGDEYSGLASLRQACNVMVGLSDPTSTATCDTAGDATDIERCRLAVFQAMADPCTGLTGIEEQVCVYEAAAAAGDIISCDHVANPAMANDCRATISQDAGYCSAIEDEQQRLSCCSSFEGTGQYETCGGDVTAAAGDTTTTSPPTTTTTTAPPPFGGDIASTDTPGFEAVYSCVKTDRGVTFDYLRSYRWDEQMMVAPMDGMTFWETIEPVHQLHYAHEYSGAVGVVVPLDGSSYGAPRDSFDMDPSEYGTQIHTYSPLVMAPSAETEIEVGGWGWPVVPYSGSFVFTIDYDVTSLGTTMSLDQTEVYNLASWYHTGTGLLLASEWSRERTVDTNNFDSDTELGMLVTESCELVDTTLYLGD